MPNPALRPLLLPHPSLGARPQIHFVNFSRRDNSKLEGLLARYFDADTTAWLLREMGENRNKSVALSKAYSYPDLRSGLGAGGGRRWGQPNGTSGRRRAPRSAALVRACVPRACCLLCRVAPLACALLRGSSSSAEAPFAGRSLSARTPAPAHPPCSKLAAEGRGAPDVVAAQQARRAVSTCGHDHLGSPAFLDKLEGQPDLLLPHLHSLSLKASRE